MTLLWVISFLLRLSSISPFDSVDSISTRSPHTTPSRNLDLDHYEISLISTNDHTNVINFLRRFFFRDEPLNRNVKLLENENSICPELEEYSMKTIADGVSIRAMTSTGRIIGVCLNGVIRKGEESEDVCKNEKFRKIVRLLKFVDRETDIFGKYPEYDKVLCVKILSVDGLCRGKGIAKKLMDRTREIARNQGFGLMRGDCTSFYSAKALARLGFNCIYTLRYKDYVENGEPVFDPPSPHTEIQIYVQKIA